MNKTEMKTLIKDMHNVMELHHLNYIDTAADRIMAQASKIIGTTVADEISDDDFIKAIREANYHALGA